MPMRSIISTFEFELDPNGLPSPWRHILLRITIRKGSVDGLDIVPEFSSNHAKEKHNSHFVNRCTDQTAKADSVSESVGPRPTGPSRKNIFLLEFAW